MAELFDADSVISAPSESSTEEVSTQPSADENETTETINQTETPSDTVAPDVESSEQVFEKEAKFDFDSLNEDDKRTFIREWLKDNNTPQFAREKGIAALKVFDGGIKESESLKNQLKEYEQRAAEFEGKQTVDEQEMEHFKGLESSLLGVKSITAKPEHIRNFIKEHNPRKYEEFIVDTAWKTLENEDGTPNEANLQKIVDRFSGYDGTGTRVLAKDVLKAVEVLSTDKAEEILPELYEFRTEEEQTAFNNARKLEQKSELANKQAREMQMKTESDYRKSVIERTQMGLRDELQSKVDPLMEQFGLTQKQGEPKDLSAYKMDTRAIIVSTMQNVMRTNPYLQEAAKALEFLQEPQGYETDQVRQELESYIGDPAFQQTVNAGYKTLMNEVEKVIASRARQYAYLAKGYEVMQKERTKTPRQIPGQGNQVPLTEEEFDTTGMSASEISAKNMERYTRQMRQSDTAQNFG